MCLMIKCSSAYFQVEEGLHICSLSLSLCGISALFFLFQIDFVILCFSNASSNIWHNDGRLYFSSSSSERHFMSQDFLTFFFSYSPVSESAMSAAEQCVYV